jgi:hypothetical protein
LNQRWHVQDRCGESGQNSRRDYEEKSAEQHLLVRSTIMAEPAVWASSVPLRLRTVFVKSNHLRSIAISLSMCGWEIDWTTPERGSDTILYWQAPFRIDEQCSQTQILTIKESEIARKLHHGGAGLESVYRSTSLPIQATVVSQPYQDLKEAPPESSPSKSQGWPEPEHNSALFDSAAPIRHARTSDRPTRNR